MSTLTGLTTRDCATGCDANACVIGDRPRCMHPCKSGIPIELLNDRVVQDAFAAACTVLGVRNVHNSKEAANG